MNEMGRREVYFVRSRPSRAFLEYLYMAATDGGAKPPPSEVLVEDDIDLVALGEQGVMVEAAVGGHPALAGGVVERAVGRASAFLASQILPARVFFRVSKGVRVADGDGTSAMSGRSPACAP